MQLQGEGAHHFGAEFTTVVKDKVDAVAIQQRLQLPVGTKDKAFHNIRPLPHLARGQIRRIRGRFAYQHRTGAAGNLRFGGAEHGERRQLQTAFQQ